jgi:hypothetical protein
MFLPPFREQEIFSRQVLLPFVWAQMTKRSTGMYAGNQIIS